MTGLHRIVLGLSRLMALAGGLVLLTLVLITCISILGRALNSGLHAMVEAGILAGLSQGLIDWGVGAIPGDFEIVEAGMAFCIFAFLPFCTVTAGHATVDVFTNALPRRANRALELVIAVLFAVVLVVIAVQLSAGMVRKVSSGQTTFLLQFPVWWAYAAALAGACLSAFVGVYMALVRLYELVSGRAVVANAVGANH